MQASNTPPALLVRWPHARRGSLGRLQLSVEQRQPGGHTPPLRARDAGACAAACSCACCSPCAFLHAGLRCGLASCLAHLSRRLPQPPRREVGTAYARLAAGQRRCACALLSAFCSTALAVWPRLCPRAQQQKGVGRCAVAESRRGASLKRTCLGDADNYPCRRPRSPRSLRSERACARCCSTRGTLKPPLSSAARYSSVSRLAEGLAALAKASAPGFAHVHHAWDLHANRGMSLRHAVLSAGCQAVYTSVRNMCAGWMSHKLSAYPGSSAGIRRVRHAAAASLWHARCACAGARVLQLAGAPELPSAAGTQRRHAPRADGRRGVVCVCGAVLHRGI